MVQSDDATKPQADLADVEVAGAATRGEAAVPRAAVPTYVALVARVLLVLEVVPGAHAALHAQGFHRAGGERPEALDLRLRVLAT